MAVNTHKQISEMIKDGWSKEFALTEVLKEKEEIVEYVDNVTLSWGVEKGSDKNATKEYIASKTQFIEKIRKVLTILPPEVSTMWRNALIDKFGAVTILEGMSKV